MDTDLDVFDTCPVISCCVKSYAGVWLRAAEKKISDTLWAHDVPPKKLILRIWRNSE